MTDVQQTLVRRTISFFFWNIKLFLCLVQRLQEMLCSDVGRKHGVRMERTFGPAPFQQLAKEKKGIKQICIN